MGQRNQSSGLGSELAMLGTDVDNKRRDAQEPENTSERSLHPAWLALIRYCRELRHGELERLSIQDGVPVIAEHVRQKVKFKS
jgi:hypothetical protein